MDYNLSKLEEVEDIRTVWANEALNFTPWLANEGLESLCETIGMSLEFVSREERNVGGIADILCKETGTDRNVIIENQLEPTDADHLGRILSYASALEAKTIIWIATKFDEQYSSTLDWLNRVTDEDLNFFGIEIHAYTIDNSLPAPQFKIVVCPNEWQKQTKATQKGELTDTKLAQLEYWQGFCNYIQNSQHKLYKPHSPRAQHWCNISIGKGSFDISCTVNSQSNIISVTMIFPQKYYDQLKKYEVDFQKEMPLPVSWVEKGKKSNSKKSQVSVSVEYDFQDENTRQEQYEWFKDICDRFFKFFQKKIKSLKEPDKSDK